MLTAFRRPQGPVGSRPLTTCSAWAAHFHTLSIEWKGEGSNYCCIKFVNAHTARAIRSFGRPPRDVPRRTTHDARATRPTCGCGCWVVCPGVCGTWRAAGWRPAPCARAPRPPARAPPAAGTSMIVIYFIEIWRDPEEAHNTIHTDRGLHHLDSWTRRRGPDADRDRRAARVRRLIPHSRQRVGQKVSATGRLAWRRSGSSSRAASSSRPRPG